MRFPVSFILLLAASSAEHEQSGETESSPGSDGEEDNVVTRSPSPVIPKAEFLRSLSSLPSCPTWDDTELTGGRPIEHDYASCDQSMVKDINLRLSRYRLWTEEQYVEHHYNVAAIPPHEKTWICPQADEGVALSTSESAGILGMPTRWVLRNKSSGPVSVGWLHPSVSHAEVSPFDARVFPPHDDANAVLEPGEYVVIEANHGHLFNVRELRDDGTGKLAPGRLLLRHMVGLTPVENRAGVDFDCPSNADGQELKKEEEEEKTSPHGRKQKETDKFAKEADAKGQDAEKEGDANPRLVSEEELPIKVIKTPEENQAQNEREWQVECNSLFADIVNRVGCPVDVFYAGASLDEGSVVRIAQGPPTCHETYAFHLGTNPAPRDYMNEDDSPVHSIGTYLSHKFVARLHHDPSIVVDEIVISADVVRDCPDSERKGGTANIVQGLSEKADINLNGMTGQGEEGSSKDKVQQEQAVALSSRGHQFVDSKDKLLLSMAVNITDEKVLSAILNGTDYQRLVQRITV